MMMLEFLTRLKTKKVETALTKRDEWLGLIVAICDGHEPDPDATLETLEHLGRTPEDLEAAVEMVQQRRQWKSEMDSAPAARAELQKLESERATLKAELTDFIAKHNEKLEPLGEREQQQLDVITAADVARRELSGRCTNQTLKARIMAAQEAIRPITDRLRLVQETRYGIQQDIENEEERDKQQDNKEDCDTKMERLRAELNQRNIEITKLETEQRRLQAEMSDAQALTLEVMSI